MSVDASTADTKAIDRQRMIVHGPILPTLLALGLPTMTVIVAQILVGLIEMYWLSRLGADVLAGVALVLPVLALIGTMSNGGIGGGVASAVARALGAGRVGDANDLVRHAIVLALAFGAVFTVALIAGGPWLYRALGGEGDALAAAVLYSNWLFAGSVPLWVMNLLAAALRGAGDVRVPAVVSLAGAALMIPLSPVLIFGFGPVPALGVAGAGVAVLIYYLGAIAYLMSHVMNGRGPLVLHAGALEWRHFSAILGVGLISALGTVVANLTTLLVTGAVGLAGTVALAGYGVASRIDTLLVPLIFGFGSAVVVMVGGAIGAGDRARARKVGMQAAAAAFVLATGIGLLAALAPGGWMRLFSDDTNVVAAGAAYLQIAAPSYGFLAAGLMLYFASQGLGAMTWPFIGGTVRLIVAAAGAWALAATIDEMQGAAIAVAAGAVAFGVINTAGFLRATR